MREGDSRRKQRPAKPCGRVDAEGLQPLSFASGAQAEQEAHALAQGFAAAGFDALIRIQDAAQALVGTVIYYAREECFSQTEYGCLRPRPH